MHQSNPYTQSIEDDMRFRLNRFFEIPFTQESIDLKLNEIEKFIKNGVDINAKDANTKNNTILHTTVLRGESAMLEFLLKKGADPYVTNDYKENPRDLLKYDIPNKEKMMNLFKQYCDNSKISCEDKSNFEKLRLDGNKELKQNNPNKLKYNKRSGTSGISGQLYETKLAMLTLFNSLNNKTFEQFFLGTNIENTGAFDDQILRYDIKGATKPNYVFLQAKHRDEPSKGPVSREALKDSNSDFFLLKYYNSYIDIIDKFSLNNKDIVFRSHFDKKNCKFLIYTSAREILPDNMKRIVNKSECIIQNTSNTINPFKLIVNEDDVDYLIDHIKQLEIISIAKILAKFIFSKTNNYKFMMSDNFIRKYHVWLRNEVITFTSSKNDFREGNITEQLFNTSNTHVELFLKTLCKEYIFYYREKSNLENSFKYILNIIEAENPSSELISKVIGSFVNYNEDDEKLKFIDNKICDELKIKLFSKKISKYVIHEAIRIAGTNKLKNYTFKVPISFGNLDWKLKPKKKNDRILKIVEKFEYLFSKSNELKITIVNDDLINENILKLTDMEYNGDIAGLVGILLVLDEENPNLIKFIHYTDTLPEHAKDLLNKLLDTKFNPYEYRFQIELKNFPKLSLNTNQHYLKVNEFLNQLIFYTNQQTHDKIEEILKNDIKSHFNSNNYNNIPINSNKIDLIYSYVHNAIQKWWLEMTDAYYLTSDCTFFDDANYIPILNILSSLCKNSLPKINFKLNKQYESILASFNNDPNKTLLRVRTRAVDMSSIKIMEIFDKHILKEGEFQNYSYIDIHVLPYLDLLNYIIPLFLYSNSHVKTLVINCEKLTTTQLNEIQLFTINNHDKFINNKKIILIVDCLKNEVFEKLNHNNLNDISDDNLYLHDLTDETKTTFLEDKSRIICQGINMNLNSVINILENENIIIPEILNIIIKDGYIEICSISDDPKYHSVKDYYIDRECKREIPYVRESHVRTHSMFYIVDGDAIGKDPSINQDILVISDKIHEFQIVDTKYRNFNVHWFKRDSANNLVWKQSSNSLDRLHDFIKFNHLVINEKNIFDIDDKVVILSGEPGMGKSTFLAIQEKHLKNQYPNAWVHKIILSNYTNMFSKWNRKTKINVKHLITFIYCTLNVRAFKNYSKLSEEKQNELSECILSNLNVDDGGNICYNQSLENKFNPAELFELYYFNSCFKSGRIVLLLDGFDEISPDFKDLILKLLNCLCTTKFLKLWISTRPYYIQHELENTLHTFSYGLKPFSKKNEYDFLLKFWRIKIGVDVDYEKFQKFSSWLLNKISPIHKLYKGQSLTSIPLHIEMIASIFAIDFMNFVKFTDYDITNEYEIILHDKLNLGNIFEEFIRKKFYDILYHDINHANPKHRKQKESEYVEMITYHMILATCRLFSKDEIDLLLYHGEKDRLNELIRDVKEGNEKTGIVCQIIDDKPNFTHMRFAEYFVSMRIWRKLKNSDSNEFKKIADQIIISVLFENENQICEFLECEMENDSGDDWKYNDNYCKWVYLSRMLIESHFKQRQIRRYHKILLKFIETTLTHIVNNSDIHNVLSKLDDNQKYAILQVVCEMGYENFLKELILVINNRQFLEKQLKCNIWNNNPIFNSLENNHNKIANILLNAFEFNVEWKDMYGRNIFEIIFDYKFYKVLRYLSSRDLVPMTFTRERSDEISYILIDAIEKNAEIDIIKLLLENIDIKVLQYSMLNVISSHIFEMLPNCIKRKEILDLIVQKGFDFTKSLSKSVNNIESYKSSAKMDIIDSMLSAGIGLQYEYEFRTIKHLQYSTFKLQFDRKDGCETTINKCKLLLEKLQNHEDSYFQIINAIKINNIDEFNYILNNNKKFDYFESILNSVDDEIGSFLHHAVYNNNRDLTEILLNNGANPNIRLHHIPNNWTTKVIDGSTPLHYANIENENLTNLLIEHNADIHAKNSNNVSPIEVTNKILLNSLQRKFSNYDPTNKISLLRFFFNITSVNLIINSKDLHDKFVQKEEFLEIILKNKKNKKFFASICIWDKMKSMEFRQFQNLLDEIYFGVIARTSNLSMFNSLMIHINFGIKEYFCDKEKKLYFICKKIVNLCSDKTIIKELKIQLLQCIDICIPVFNNQDINSLVSGFNEDELLLTACKMGYENIVILIINKKTDKNFLIMNCEWQKNPIWFACEGSHRSIVKISIEKFTFNTYWRDIHNNSFIEVVLRKREQNILKICLEFDLVPIGYMPNYMRTNVFVLFEAISEEFDFDIIKLILRKIKINEIEFSVVYKLFKNAFYIPITDIRIYYLMINHGIDLTPCLTDTMNGSKFEVLELDIIDKMLSLGVGLIYEHGKINYQQQYFGKNNSEVQLILLEQKILETLKLHSELFHRFKHAIKCEDYDTIQQIIENTKLTCIKSVINSQDNEIGSPLCYSVYKDNIKLTRILLQNGANPNIRIFNKPNLVSCDVVEGSTPLFIAAQNISKDMTKLLLDFDANIFIKNKNNKSAIESNNKIMLDVVDSYFLSRQTNNTSQKLN